MQNLSDFIKKQADCCVKCGLCLPHCPTYLNTKHEGESPRGRIALLEGIATGNLPLTPKTQTYLDHCLGCRACENVCPVPVKYGALLIAGREFIEKKRSFFPIHIKFYLKKILLKIIPKLYLLRKKFPENPQAAIGLIPGCIHSFFEKKILLDAMKVLHYLHIPFSTINHFKCCGGLHLHAGEKKSFEKQQKENQKLFEKYEVILSTATGCTSVLQQFTSPKTQDITIYFSNLLNKILPSQKILIHLPCTSNKEKLFQESHHITYLKHSHCCGASGTYFLEHTEMAKKIAEGIIEEVKSISPDIFITHNIGCAIHLKNQFKKNGLGHIKIQHPINLLADNLHQLDHK